MRLLKRSLSGHALRTVIFILAPFVVFGAAVLAGFALELDQHPYLGGLVATSAGVFAGGALALLSDRFQERGRRRAAELDGAAARRQANLTEMHVQRRVVGLLHDELHVSVEAMNDPAGRAKRPRPDLFYTPLPHSTWDAITASGELAHVPSPDLLGSFAEAYHWVAVVNGFESQMIHLQYDPATITGAFVAEGAGGHALRQMFDRLRERLEGLDEPAREVIAAAVRMASDEFDRIEAEITALREA